MLHPKLKHILIKNRRRLFLIESVLVIALFVLLVYTNRSSFRVPFTDAQIGVPPKLMQITQCNGANPCVLAAGSTVSDPWQDVNGDAHITGRVGIGTTNPSYPLDIAGTSVVGIRYLRTDNKDARIMLGDNSGTRWSWSVGWDQPGDLTLLQEGVAGDIIYFKQGGNVGIGTGNPGTKLDVNGDARANNIYFGGVGAALTTNQGGSIELGPSVGTGQTPFIDFHFGAGSAQDFNTRIINDANGRLQISAVGAGVPAQLYVNGLIFTNQLEMGGNPMGWPDYGCANCGNAINGNPDLWLTAQSAVRVQAPGGFCVNGTCTTSLSGGSKEVDIPLGSAVGRGGDWRDVGNNLGGPAPIDFTYNASKFTGAQAYLNITSTVQCCYGDCSYASPQPACNSSWPSGYNAAYAGWACYRLINVNNGSVVAYSNPVHRSNITSTAADYYGGWDYQTIPVTLTDGGRYRVQASVPGNTDCGAETGSKIMFVWP